MTFGDVLKFLIFFNFLVAQISRNLVWDLTLGPILDQEPEGGQTAHGGGLETKQTSNTTFWCISRHRITLYDIWGRFEIFDFFNFLVAEISRNLVWDLTLGPILDQDCDQILIEKLTNFPTPPNFL